LGFVGAWFFLILAPSSSIQPLPDNITEHRMYLSLAAIITLLVIGGDYFLHKGLSSQFGKHLRQPVTVCLLAVIVAILAYLTYARNKDYQNAVSFWSDNIKKQPNSSRAYNCLGIAYMKQGNLDKATTQYKLAIRINANYADAWNNLGTVSAQQGKWTQAETQYKNTIRIDPNSVNAHFNLGNVFLKQGNLKQAADHFEQVTRINPGDIETHINLAHRFMQQENLPKALAHFEKAIELNPNNLKVTNSLAWLLATHPKDNVRNGARAVELAKHACNITDYKVPELLDTLATAYAEENRFAEAVETAAKALALAKSQKRPPAKIQQIRLRLEQYKAQKPFRWQP